MTAAAEQIKRDAVLAFRAWDRIRCDPMASRDEIEQARLRFVEASKRHSEVRDAVSAMLIRSVSESGGDE